MRRGSVGEQIELAFLDQVLHLAARAIDRLVEIFSGNLPLLQRGDNKTRIGLIAGPLRLADDTALAAPTIARAPREIGKAPGRLAGSPGLRLGLFQLRRDP